MAIRFCLPALFYFLFFTLVCLFPALRVLFSPTVLSVRGFWSAVTNGFSAIHFLLCGQNGVVGGVYILYM